MRKAKIIIIPFFILLFSCSMQKRKYVNGYYLSRKDHKPAEKPMLSASSSKIPLIVYKAGGDSCDTLVLIDNSLIKARVKEINEKEIRYVRCDMPDGPLYVESKFKIKAINYKDGRKEMFAINSVPHEAGKEWQDSCMIIIKKNGEIIKAKIMGSSATAIRYGFCDGTIGTYTASKSSISKIMLAGRNIINDQKYYLDEKDNEPLGDTCAVITCSNGELIKAHILNINSTEIRYTFCENPSKVFVLKKNMVSKISSVYFNHNILDDYKNDYETHDTKNPSAFVSLILSLLALISLVGGVFLTLNFFFSGSILLITGVLLIYLSILLGVAAFIFGLVGMSKIRKTRGQINGSGAATTGIVIGSLFTLVFLILLAAVLLR